MPENTPVYGAGNGQPAGYLTTPTADEAHLAALRAERGGYEALLADGRTERGGESITDILNRIDGQIEYYAARVPSPLDKLAGTGNALTSPSPDGDEASDDVPPPPKPTGRRGRA